MVSKTENAGVPLVSVIIPARRGGPFLRTAVSSAISQTISDLEVLVISDDCPEDLSDLEAMDPRVQVIRRPHGGVSISRNVGILRSRGQFIAFLDEDDLYFPERIEKQIEALREDGESRVASCMIDLIGPDGSKIGEPGIRRRANYRIHYIDMLRERGVVPMPTLLARREVVGAIGGFNPALLTTEDFEFELRLAMESPILVLPDTLVSVRKHANNMTDQIDPATDARDMIRLWNQHRRRARRSGQRDLEEAARQGIRFIRHDSAWGAYRAARRAADHGVYKDVARLAAVSILLDPSVALSVAARLSFRRFRNS